MLEPLSLRRIVRVAGSAFATLSRGRIAVAAVTKSQRRRSVARPAAIIGLCGVQVLVLSLVVLSRSAEMFGDKPDSGDGAPLLFSLAELIEEDDDKESDLPQDGLAAAARVPLQGGSTVIERSASVPIRAREACGIAYSRPPPHADRCARRVPNRDA